MENYNGETDKKKSAIVVEYSSIVVLYRVL